MVRPCEELGHQERPAETLRSRLPCLAGQRRRPVDRPDHLGHLPHATLRGRWLRKTRTRSRQTTPTRTAGDDRGTATRARPDACRLPALATGPPRCSPPEEEPMVVLARPAPT